MEEDKNKLRRYDDKPMIPDLFNKLDKEKQEKLAEKYANTIIDLEKTKREKMIKSEAAENDLKIGADNLRGLESKDRIYTHNQSVETGSGRIDIKVKGGDTKFIIPILAVLGIIAIIVLAIVFL